MADTTIQVAAEEEAAALAQRETASVEDRALAIKVACAADYEAATAIKVEIARAEKRVEAERTNLTGPINTTLRRINDLFRPFGDRLAAARRTLDAKMVAWRAEEQRKADEERRWAEEQKRKAEAEEQAKRLAAERATREQEEARRRAAQAKRDAEDAERRAADAKTAAARKEAEDARIKAEAERKAADMMARHKAAEAQAATEAQAKAQREQVAAQSTAIAAQQDKPATTVAAGGGRVSARRSWTFEITDESKIPPEFLTVNEKAIRAAVKAGVRAIPGVRIYEQESLAVSS